MKRNPDNLRVTGQAGFSLVDVMVGMVIALLGVIIMFQVFSVSEGIKRTTASGGDALQNGAMALFSLERSLREAGYGIFASNNLPPQPSDLATTASVAITAGAANASDTIVLTYRQNWDFGPFPPEPAVFAAAVPPALTIETITVNNFAQLESRTTPDTAPPYTTLLPAAAATGPTVIADGIVLLKAEYGTDANGNEMIEAGEWNRTPPADVRSVLAVRLAVVARSAQPEKPDPATGVCNTTEVYPTWVASAAVPLDVSAGVGLAAGDDWKCYRYKTFENTVLLRNRRQ